MPLNYSIWDMVVWAIIFVIVWKIIEWLFGIVSGFVYNITHKRESYHNYNRRNQNSKLFKGVVIALLMIGGYYVISQGYGKEIITNVSEKVNFGVNEANTYQGAEEVEEEDIMDICKTELNYYEDLFRNKYGLSVDTIKIEKANKDEDVSDFVNLWGASDLMVINPLSRTDWESNKKFPVVMIAIRRSNFYSQQIPFVLACDDKGKLTEQSKSYLT